MKTVAIIQARLGSTRLPGKVLRELAGRPMIDWVVTRIEKCQRIDEVVVATSNRSTDDALAAYCDEKNWNVVRGSENDVLSRYVLAAEEFQADNIVRITADCPLIDPEITDKVVEKLESDSRIDYACNFFPVRRFARGLDAEAFTMSTLETVDQLAVEPAFREHVTLMIYRQSERFNLGSVTNKANHSNYRWTVDTADDFQLVDAIANSFNGMEFGYQDIIRAYAQNPEWDLMNRHVQQKAA